MAGLCGLVPGLVLQRHVLQDGQQQWRAVIGTHPAWRKPEHPQPAQRIHHPPVDLARGLVTGVECGQPSLARLQHLGMVLRSHEVE